MLTTSGFRAFLASSVASQIVSEATAEPPGLSIRNTIARTLLSAGGLAERAGQVVRADAAAAGKRIAFPPA